jgi:hypothetical protein
LIIIHFNFIMTLKLKITNQECNDRIFILNRSPLKINIIFKLIFLKKIISLL